MDSLLGLGINQDDILTDKVSGAKTDRFGLGACLSNLQQGDTLVVGRLDRLRRSMYHLVKLIEEHRDRGGLRNPKSQIEAAGIDPANDFATTADGLSNCATAVSATRF